MIYFATARDIGRFKIGYARDPQKRIEALQTGCPAKLEIECVVEGGYDLEAKLHQVFRKYRTHGEWFELNEIVDMALDWLKSGEAVPENIAEYVFEWRVGEAAKRMAPLVREFFSRACISPDPTSGELARRAVAPDPSSPSPSSVALTETHPHATLSGVGGKEGRGESFIITGS